MTQDVIVLGFVPMAKKVIWHLYGLDKANIVGVVTVDREMSTWRSTESSTPVSDTCAELNIPLIEQKDILDYGPDIGFTVRYPHILSEDILNAFDFGVVNFHGGYLPAYRGAHAANHVLLNNEEWHGATLHFCDPGIDTGPILDRKKFPIQPNDTSYTLYQKAKLTLWKMYVNNVEDILSRDIIAVNQNEIEPEREPMTNYRNDLGGKKEVDLNDDAEEVVRTIRAFDFPTHEPAYMYIDGEKIRLRTGWNKSWPAEYDIEGIINDK